MRNLVEAAPVRLARVLVAGMPLAEYAGRVGGAFEDLGNRHRVQTHPLAFENRVGDGILEVVATRQKRAARK